MSNKQSEQKNDPKPGTVSASDPIAGPQTATALATVDQPNYTLPIVFYDAVQQSAKSPTHKGLLELDGVMRGTSIQVSVFHDAERGFSVGKIGGRFPILEGNSKTRTDKETGEEFPQYNFSAVGNAKLKKLPEEILSAFHRFQATKQRRQFVTLQIEALAGGAHESMQVGAGA